MSEVTSSAISTAKAVLRREFGARLLELAPRQRSAASARVTERLLELPEIRHAQRLLVCLSFGAELDTAPLVGHLLDSGRELFVPRASRADGLLHIHRYPCPLITLSFGLRQPAAGTPELARDAIDPLLDAVLVLGLAFDRRGYRLGYGGGFFDRFLAGRPFPAIALAHDLQLVDELPVEAHDVPMRVIVSESTTVRPAGPVGAVAVAGPAV